MLTTNKTGTRICYRTARTNWFDIGTCF